MPYTNEVQMYPDIAFWLKEKLKGKYRSADIATYDVHSQYLNKFIAQQGLAEYCEDYPSYEIKVDIIGIVKRAPKLDLVFVECKISEITLRDISQLLGYSRVATPLHSILLSPQSVSKSVSFLFNTLRKYDVLNYDQNKRIIIGQWRKSSKDVDPTSLIPKGEFF